ncbi:MAG: type II toxin-antitoxin system YafQ family toxin [Candidatus Pacebacteria bacterium]|nr:type II toxin-antitoxin system YafQ family toxin [Candidatus Paceibacterota bacterium]
MLKIKYSNKFKKNLKHYEYNSNIIKELETILNILTDGGRLPFKNSNHSLSGEFKGCFECHIKPDVLLIYKIKKEESIILLLRIGSHSEIF